jgi:hypothetical protein
MFDSGGGSSSTASPTLPTAFRTRTPGLALNSGLSNDNKFVTSLSRLGSPAQTAFSERFPRALGDLDRLRGTLTPGFSKLREARLGAVENARSRSIGTLRESLARRRVLGSSFADDARIRAEREFAEAAAQEEAKSFLEELDSNLRLIEVEGNAVESAMQRELQELGIVTGTDVQLSSLISNNTQFERRLAAQEQQAAGSFYGSLINTGATLAGTLGSAYIGS